MSAYPTPTLPGGADDGDDDIPQPIAGVRTSPGMKLVQGGTDAQGRPTLTIAPDGSVDFAAVGRRAKQVQPAYSDMDDAELGQKIMAKHPEFGQMLATGANIPTAVSQNPATAAQMQSPPPSGPHAAPTPTQGPSGTPVDATGTPTPPPDSMLERILLRAGVSPGMVSVMKGSAKSGGQLAVGTADLLHKVLPISALEATPQERQSTVPSNNTERYAKVGTDVVTALAPGGAATKVAKAAELAPAATTALRILLNAGFSGGWNKMQGGSFKTGAVLGGAGEGVASGITSLAPKILRSVIPGIDNPTATALLQNTSGFKPATIAASAEDAVPQMVQNLENFSGQAGKVPVSTKPALKVVDDAMKKAVNANDTETMANLRTIRQKLLNTTVAGSQARPSEALGISNTLDDLSQSLPGNVKTSYGPAQVASKARDALETELEKAAPGTRDTAETIRKLVTGGKAAKDATNGNPNLVTHLARHTLYDMLAGGSMYGATHSPLASGAAMAVTHAATSPAARAAAARAAASPMTPQLLNVIKSMMMTASQPNGLQ